MRKLVEVEAAKELMTEARQWSVMKWLREKKRVRKAADTANEALDKLNQETKALWPADLKMAYSELLQGKKPSSAADDLLAFAKQMKEADDDAGRARMQAEETFDKAERILSTSLAREGCGKAIVSWELHEKAIRKAEAGIRTTKAVG